MPQAFVSVTSTVEQLSERLRDLERRVAALEGQPEKPPAPERNWPTFHIQRPRPPATWRGFPPADVPAGTVPVLGKAVLGIAGAYLLRAIAESGTIPKVPVLMVAIVYAGMWLVWAVRTHDTNRFASVTYGDHVGTDPLASAVGVHGAFSGAVARLSPRWCWSRLLCWPWHWHGSTTCR